MRRLEGLKARRRKVCSLCGPWDKVTFVVPPGCTPDGLCVECGERRVFSVKASGAAKFDAAL